MNMAKRLLSTAGLALAGIALIAGPVSAAGNGNGETRKGPVARGNNLLGGSLSFSSAGNGYYQDQDGDRTQEWTVCPGGGYFVSDGLAFCFHLEGRWFSQGDVRRTSYAMGPVLEYYWDTTGGEESRGKILPYVGLGYLWGQDRDESAAGTAKYNSGLVTVSAGLAWLLSDQVATDIALNYRSGRFTEKIPEDGRALRADRFSIFLGIKVFLP